MRPAKGLKFVRPGYYVRNLQHVVHRLEESATPKPDGISSETAPGKANPDEGLIQHGGGGVNPTSTVLEGKDVEDIRKIEDAIEWWQKEGVSKEGEEGRLMRAREVAFSFAPEDKDKDKDTEEGRNLSREEREKGTNLSAYEKERRRKYLPITQTTATGMNASANENGAGIESKMMSESQMMNESQIMNEEEKKEARKVVEIEPWDEAFFPLRRDELGVILGVDGLVYHPVPIRKPKPAGAMSHGRPVKIFLTEREKKKLRHRTKMEREQEKRDQIRMGLRPPDPPRVKLSNLMRVLGESAAANPTKVEREVVKQLEKRLKEHQDRNEARKLTEEQKRAKKARQWQGSRHGTEPAALALFLLPDVTERQILYKLHVNAKELHLKGVLLLCPGVANLAIVQSHPRALDRFKTLLTKRIAWAAPPPPPLSPQTRTHSQCVCVWEGSIATTLFKRWTLVPCGTETEARKELAIFGATEYLEMALRARDRNSDLLKS